MKNVKNSIYGAADALISPILMLLATPIFLSYLGVERYALWVLVNSIIAFMGVFNLGGSDVVTKFVSASRRDSSQHSASEIFSLVFAFQSIIVLVIYLLFVIVIPIVIQYTESNNILLLTNILYIAIPIFFMKQSEELLYAFFKGYEQFGHVVIMSIVSKTLFFLVQVLIAAFTESVLKVFYGALIISTLLLLSQIVYIKIIHKNNISFSKVRIKTAKSLLSFSGWNGLSSLLYILKSQSDKWMVSGLLGLKTFGFYSIGVLIFNQLHRIIGSSIYWIFPEVSKNNLDKKALSIKYWKLLISVGAISLLISVVLMNIEFLFQLWLGNEVFQSSKYYISTFLLLFPIFTLNIVPELFLLGLGLAKRRFFADVISLIVKVLTIWLAISIFNIKEWLLFFAFFIAVEFIAYAIIISKYLPIKLIHLIVFLVLQILIIFARV